VETRIGFLDQSGSVVIKPAYDDCGKFSEGLVAVQAGGMKPKWSFIDRTGKQMITFPSAVQAVLDFSEGFAGVRVSKASGSSFAIETSVGQIFGPGIGAYQSGCKWGFVDRSGNYVIEPQYDSVGCFRDGLAPVLVNDLWGFIDKNNQFVVKPIYDHARIFSEGMAVVEREGKHGYIDTTGELRVPLAYRRAHEFREGVGVAAGFDGFVALDRSGTLLTGRQTFDDSAELESGVFPSFDYASSGPAFDAKSGKFAVTAFGGHVLYNSRKRKAKNVPVAYLDRNGEVKIVLKLPVDGDVRVYPFYDQMGVVNIETEEAHHFFICNERGELKPIPSSFTRRFNEGLMPFFGFE